jgi:hypothetical protein
MRNITLTPKAQQILQMAYRTARQNKGAIANHHRPASSTITLDTTEGRGAKNKTNI